MYHMEPRPSEEQPQQKRRRRWDTGGGAQAAAAAANADAAAPSAPAPAPHHNYLKRIEASAGWKAAKEHDHYAALDQESDGDSGYNLRDGTHVERHVGSPRS